MEVFEVVHVKGKGDKIAQVHLSEVECRMLLTYAINDLLDKGSITLLSEEDQEKLKGMEQFLSAPVEGSA